jgi:COP9 signalosome complex subunit 4
MCYTLTTGSNQKDRTTAYLSLLSELLAAPISTSEPLVSFGRHFTTSTSMATVVGRRVLGSFVTALCGGSGMDKLHSASGGEEAVGDDENWEKFGLEGFQREEGRDVRKSVVEGVLAGGAAGGWCDEQVSHHEQNLCTTQAHVNVDDSSPPLVVTFTSTGR